MMRDLSFYGMVDLERNDLRDLIHEETTLVWLLFGFELGTASSEFDIFYTENTT